MTITEKTAYLKGLLEGMEIDQSTKEGKLLAAIIDTLDDIALSVADLDDEVGAINDEMDMMEESLDAIDEALDDSFAFVKENDVCTIMSYKGNVFGVEVPNFADLVVTATEPGFAGNTATNTLKPATLETGAEVKVPLFINEGEKIQVDTRTGEYLGRSKA